MHGDISPEDRFCLLLARGEITPDIRKWVLEIVSSPLRWPAVLERVSTHQIQPLVYRNLLDLGFPSVPDAVQAQLKSAFLANWRRNEQLARELGLLLALLGNAGIHAIPLKGIALAESLYGDASLRVGADIDILVPADQVARALDLTLAYGYRSEFKDPFFAKLVSRHGRHHHVVREDVEASFSLELHWKLIQYSSRNNDAVNDLWAEAQPRTVFGAPALSLSPEWEFLYLCIHAADHNWQCLKWLVDIHQIVSAGRVDWRKAAVKARAFEVGQVIQQTLAATSHLLGTPLPACYSAVKLPVGLKLFAHGPFPAGAADGAFGFFHMRVLRRPLDKLRYIATVVFVPQLPDRDFWPLPSSLGWLYYLVRPVRLLGKWISRLALAMIRPDSTAT